MPLLQSSGCTGPRSGIGHGGHARWPGTSGRLIAIGIDTLPAGLRPGSGLVAGAKEDTLLAVALAFEPFSLGLAPAVELQREVSPQNKPGHCHQATEEGK